MVERVELVDIVLINGEFLGLIVQVVEIFGGAIEAKFAVMIGKDVQSFWNHGGWGKEFDRAALVNKGFAPILVEKCFLSLK